MVVDDVRPGDVSIMLIPIVVLMEVEMTIMVAAVVVVV